MLKTSLRALLRYKDKLPPLLPGWDCELIPWEHAEYQKRYDGMCFEDKRIHLYIHEDIEEYRFTKRIGRTFDLPTGLAFVYLHEWWHSLEFFRDARVSQSEKKADTFALSYLMAMGIVTP